MPARNPKNINHKLERTATVCTFHDGRYDGMTELISDETREWRVATWRGNGVVNAVYVRVTPCRFMFERYEP